MLWLCRLAARMCGPRSDDSLENLISMDEVDMNNKYFCCFVVSIMVSQLAASVQADELKPIVNDRGALADHRHRVLVSSDIGGTDPDDFQSMVHLLLYADVLDMEGLVASPYGPGRKEDIFKVIDCYAEDYDNLLSHSQEYPSPDALRAIAKQGELERAPYAGYRKPTEGSEWIIECAKRDDPRPLYVLVWGGLEDLAQALHDAPEITSKLRVYWIGGPNKKWSPDAYQYVAENHKDLWIIEANATYRGWFVGGNQKGAWGNGGFVEQHVAGHGSLGKFFDQQLPEMKMGDSPSVTWLLKGNPKQPTEPSWGGRFVRAWERPNIKFEHLPTKNDKIEEFSILELALPSKGLVIGDSRLYLDVENQSLQGEIREDETIRFRFCPKAAKVYKMRLTSSMPDWQERKFAIVSFTTPPERLAQPSAEYPNWWTDDPSEEFRESGHIGTKTISRWREDFLQDFANRMDRCLPAN